ncbi:MAG: DUF2807 domain-containing protein [Cyclobacteriaceae bacterium]|jgi:hypothetical protein|nr:DUF2807 domain-containing protein [Cyclobacteriaceae bacterium]
MRYFIYILFLLTTIAGWAQQSEVRKVQPFTGIKVSQGIDVYLRKGNQESVRVEVSGISLSSVITEVSGDMLKVQLDDGRYRGSHTVKVYVTFVQITKLMASSAGNFYGESTIESKSLSLNTSSAASIELTVKVEQLHASASSAGDMELKGSAKYVEMDASSAGEINGYDLEAEEARVEASSAGDIKISVTQKIEAYASSGASIRYRGNPMKTNTNASSGGSVKKSS